MEPITHALASFAAARATQRRLPRFGAAMFVAAGVAPDLDLAGYFGGASAYLRFHRAALHGLLGGAALACAVAAAFCWADRKYPRKIAPSAGCDLPRRSLSALRAWVCTSRWTC